MKINIKQNSAFTLVELLITIAILSIIPFGCLLAYVIYHFIAKAW
jgi:prepilin-type N-terminal cleavage/methylation domain-containing protein